MNKYGQYGAWNGAQYQECHEGNTKLLSYNNGAGLYIGGWSRDANPQDNWAVIDLTGNHKPSANQIEAYNVEAEAAFARTIGARQAVMAPWLKLEVQDFHAPSWGKPVLNALAEDVGALLAANTNVLMACQGGHGRSGTVALALTYLLCGNREIFVPDPVAWLRKIYCQQAVETNSQIDWLWQVLDLKQAKPKPVEKHIAVWQEPAGTVVAPKTVAPRTDRTPEANECWICSTATESTTGINGHPLCAPCAIVASGDSPTQCYWCNIYDARLVAVVPPWWTAEDRIAIGEHRYLRLCADCFDEIALEKAQPYLVCCDACREWKSAYNSLLADGRMLCDDCGKLDGSSAWVCARCGQSHDHINILDEQPLCDACLKRALDSESTTESPCWVCGVQMRYTPGTVELAGHLCHRGCTTKHGTNVPPSEIGCYICGSVPTAQVIPSWWTQPEAIGMRNSAPMLCAAHQEKVMGAAHESQ